MHRYTPIDWFAWGLTTIGALNWGLRGLSSFNLVRALFGNNPMVERMVYNLVGLSGVWSLVRFFEYVSSERPMERPIERTMERMRQMGR